MNDLQTQVLALREAITGWQQVRGTAVWTPYRNGYSITIGKWPQTENVQWPTHTHEGWEVLVCMHGTFRVKVGEHEFLMTEGDSTRIAPGVPHSAVNLTPQAEMIGICKPAEECYL